MTAVTGADDRSFLVTRDVFQTFVGPNASEYGELWDKQKSGKPGRPSFGFLILVFLAPLPWLMYRKLYGYAAPVLLVPIAIAILFPEHAFKINNALSFGFAFVLKYLYIGHAESKIRKIQARTSPGPDRDAQLSRAGGVSLVAGVIGGVIFVAQITVYLLSAHHPA
jgi:hypothetical protein